MSTGQPPSDKTSDGDKGSKSGQPSAGSAADKPEPKRAQALSVDDGWDVRDGPTSAGGAARPSLPGGRESAPPTSSPLRGKFTVGSLLGATQAVAPAPAKKGAAPAQPHRQQIGALPQRPLSRSATSAAITEPPPAPKTPLAASQESPRVPVAFRKTTPSQPFGVQTGAAAQLPERRTTPSQPFAAQAPAQAALPVVQRRNTPPQPFGAASSSEPHAAESITPSQPFAAVAPQQTASAQQSAPSQPFAEIAPPTKSEIVVARPSATAGAVSSSRASTESTRLTARGLLEPELNERTPRGIGAVVLDKSAAAPAEPTLKKAGGSALFVAPIIPIASTDDASADAAAPDREPLPAVAPSRPPAPAPVLDDPDGWEVPHDTAAPAAPLVSATPPPVATDAEPAPRERESSAKVAAADEKSKKSDKRASSSKMPAAKDKASTSDRKIRASRDESAQASGKYPSSHSKLQRAGNVETELSGEFFAVENPEGSDSGAHYPYDLLDERHRRSLSPEVVARRARYRVIVVLVVVGLVLLLGAAIALKVLGKIR